MAEEFTGQGVSGGLTASASAVCTRLVSCGANVRITKEMRRRIHGAKTERGGCWRSAG